MPVINIQEPKKRIRASELAIGQLGVDDDGAVLLRLYNAVVSLTDPQNTYSTACGIWVVPVPSGSTVSFIAP